MKKATIPQPTSRFLKVKCNGCKNEQVVFGSATSVVPCAVCGMALAEPTGGKAVITAKILQVLG